MKTRRQTDNEKVQREIFTLFNKSDILNMNGAKVYLIVEYNGMLKIYSSSNDEGWPPSKEKLVNDFFTLGKRELTAHRRNCILCQNGSVLMISGGEESAIEKNLKRGRNQKPKAKPRVKDNQWEAGTAGRARKANSIKAVY